MLNKPNINKGHFGYAIKGGEERGDMYLFCITCYISERIAVNLLKCLLLKCLLLKCAPAPVQWIIKLGVALLAYIKLISSPLSLTVH